MWNKNTNKKHNHDEEDFVFMILLCILGVMVKLLLICGIINYLIFISDFSEKDNKKPDKSKFKRKSKLTNTVSPLVTNNHNKILFRFNNYHHNMTIIDNTID